MRAVLEAAGIRNILTKCQGTPNPHNVIKATVQALQQLRSAEEALRARGKTLEEMLTAVRGRRWRSSSKSR